MACFWYHDNNLVILFEIENGQNEAIAHYFNVRGKSGLPTNKVPSEQLNATEEGATLWIVPQKITAILRDGKGENVR